MTDILPGGGKLTAYGISRRSRFNPDAVYKMTFRDPEARDLELEALRADPGEWLEVEAFDELDAEDAAAQAIRDLREAQC